ncbi:MAG: hypothetical protein AAF557_18755 [Pseudomonadota bacterium]
MPQPSRRKTRPTLEFIGPPHRLHLVGDMPASSSLDVKLENKLAKFCDESRRPVRLRKDRDGHVCGAKLKLDRFAPPGEYKADVNINGDDVAATVVVQEHERLTLRPAQIAFRGEAGDTAHAAAILENTGNVVFDVPRTIAVGIFDDLGVEDAFGAAYRDQIKTADAFMTAFTNKLRESHGGLAKIKVASGAGKLPPGKMARLKFELKFARDLKVGHRYHAVWATGATNFAISIAVTA